MDIHQIWIFVTRKSKISRTSPELITRWIILIPKAFWRSRVPPGLYLRIFHFGRGNPVVHLNFQVSELDISSPSRTFPELITRWIIFIPTAFWRSRAPPRLYLRVLHLGLGNPLVHFIFDGKGVQSFWLSLVLWFIFDDSRPNRQRDSEMHFGF